MKSGGIEGGDVTKEETEMATASGELGEETEMTTASGELGKNTQDSAILKDALTTQPNDVEAVAKESSDKLFEWYASKAREDGINDIYVPSIIQSWVFFTALKKSETARDNWEASVSSRFYPAFVLKKNAVIKTSEFEVMRKQIEIFFAMETNLLPFCGLPLKINRKNVQEFAKLFDLRFDMAEEVVIMGPCAYPGKDSLDIVVLEKELLSVSFDVNEISYTCKALKTLLKLNSPSFYRYRVVQSTKSLPKEIATVKL